MIAAAPADAIRSGSWVGDQGQEQFGHLREPNAADFGPFDVFFPQLLVLWWHAVEHMHFFDARHVVHKRDDTIGKHLIVRHIGKPHFVIFDDDHHPVFGIVHIDEGLNVTFEIGIGRAFDPFGDAVSAGQEGEVAVLLGNECGANDPQSQFTTLEYAHSSIPFVPLYTHQRFIDKGSFTKRLCNILMPL